MYNPELLDKQRVLAITKCDLVNEQTKKKITKHYPIFLPFLFHRSQAKVLIS
jgi:hypothetical protein